VVSPSEAYFAIGNTPGLINDSASARWLGAADSASIAAAAAPRQRTRPRLGSRIFNMSETSPRCVDEGLSHAPAHFGTFIAIAPNIKLETAM
jgi:hypothetical protein